MIKKLLAASLAVVPTVALASVAVVSSTGLIPAIVQLVIVALCFWAVWWFIGYVGVPEPFNKVIRVIVGLAALLYILNFLLSLTGSPLFVWGGR